MDPHRLTKVISESDRLTKVISESDEIIRIGNDDDLGTHDSLTLKRIYYVNKSSNDVRKIISTLVQGKLR